MKIELFTYKTRFAVRPNEIIDVKLGDNEREDVYLDEQSGHLWTRSYNQQLEGWLFMRGEPNRCLGFITSEDSDILDLVYLGEL